jgi:hypothetical protein
MGLINAALWPPDPPVLERLNQGFQRGASAAQ